VSKKNRVDQCVEVMCQKGCKTLWADIEALENGATLPEVELFTASECEQVLVELKAIMAVYGNSGSCTPD